MEALRATIHPPEEFYFTEHGRQRAEARSISESGIRAALRWGRRYWSHGCRIFRLDRRSVARASGHRVDIRAYEGVAVVLTPDGSVRTTWRNRDPDRIQN